MLFRRPISVACFSKRLWACLVVCCVFSIFANIGRVITLLEKGTRTRPGLRSTDRAAQRLNFLHVAPKGQKWAVLANFRRATHRNPPHTTTVSDKYRRMKSKAGGHLLHSSISTLCPRNESPNFQKSGRCVGKRFRKKITLATALTLNASGWPYVATPAKQATGGTKLRGAPLANRRAHRNRPADRGATNAGARLRRSLRSGLAGHFRPNRRRSGEKSATTFDFFSHAFWHFWASTAEQLGQARGRKSLNSNGNINIS